MQETVADEKDFPLTPALSLQGEGEIKYPGRSVRYLDPVHSTQRLPIIPKAARFSPIAKGGLGGISPYVPNATRRKT